MYEFANCQCKQLRGSHMCARVRGVVASINITWLCWPGFTRVSLPFFTKPEEVDYVLDAIHSVADHGENLVNLLQIHNTLPLWSSLQALLCGNGIEIE